MQSIKVEDAYKSYNGELQIIVRDKHGNVIEDRREKNIVKIFAKEILSHTAIHTKVWDPNANTGSGDWVDHGLDLDKYSLKYIVFGASYDQNNLPLDSSDARYYTVDSITGQSIPVRLYPGADFDGGLINAIPISEPTRPLKRIERIYYEPSYQPAGTPLLQEDVRAINNVLVVETTLRQEEYNGFGLTIGDYFTITEAALVAAPEVGSLAECECDPRDIFLSGPYDATANGFSTISLTNTADVANIKEGDQIKIVMPDSTAAEDLILNQLNPYYLVINKLPGGKDMTLDRVPVDAEGTPIIGNIGVFRDDFRIFSHRILNSPVKKSSDYVITVRWRIIMN